MSSELVLTDLDQGVLTITLNRPEKRNALSLELFQAIGEAFKRAAEPEVLGVLLRGAGAVFCAGIDLNSLAAIGGGGNGADFRVAGGELQGVYMRLERIGQPAACAI